MPSNITLSEALRIARIRKPSSELRSFLTKDSKAVPSLYPTRPSLDEKLRYHNARIHLTPDNPRIFPLAKDFFQTAN